MNAVSFGNLLAGAARIPSSEARVSFWRRTFDVSDSRAQVGRILGDGSARQGKIILSTIIEVAKKWFKKANEDARNAFAAERAAYANAGEATGQAPTKQRPLKWNVLTTLDAVLGFTDFKTGECIATYEMIAQAAECGRDTVYRHLNILRDLGLIDWVRRCEPTDNKKQPTKAAPNAYFFEITRLPSPVQMLMRQILKRRGVTLAAHPDRVGSGKVPNRVQRLADRLGKTLTGAADFLRRGKERAEKVDEAAFVREEMALMGDIPTDQWAAIRHPDDAAAQASYNARLGILSFATESMEMPLHSPPTEPDRKD
ncbi:helix-turn-helix domain-containing protein [uncultured Novosphingobium sp.]|uniref:helix-turn-helix domain-containing protein n=1 Tax=uncultured Novosphingobium sp. TaxID=292277 RepID=UPI0025956CA7|nr:helix-turn-helix domain-containing protein [uncultured Novosphingobium sp.]